MEANMARDSARQFANLLGVLAALTVNILATTIPLNGRDTGAISDQFKVYFVPAGYVFAIWGLIYIGWIAFLVYQFLPGQKESPRLRKLGYLFALSCLFNGGWLFCWHWGQFGLSVIVMLALLATLLASYLRLGIGRLHVGAAERWCVDIPFGAYLGWITVATVANISDYLYFVGWDGFGISPQIWAVIMLVVASLLGLGMALTRRDAAYVLVLVWAFVGIALKHSAVVPVMMTAWAAAALALLLAVLALAQSARKRLPQRSRA
jgi:benzodiazapine receptor